MSKAKQAAGKSLTSEKKKFKFQQASSAIAGTADSLKRQLSQLDAGVLCSQDHQTHAFGMLLSSSAISQVEAHVCPNPCRVERRHQRAEGVCGIHDQTANSTS